MSLKLKSIVSFKTEKWINKIMIITCYHITIIENTFSKKLKRYKKIFALVSSILGVPLKMGKWTSIKKDGT